MSAASVSPGVTVVGATNAQQMWETGCMGELIVAGLLVGDRVSKWLF
ncbi:hypothetical protein [Paenibacillus sp. LjRoot56]